MGPTGGIPGRTISSSTSPSKGSGKPTGKPGPAAGGLAPADLRNLTNFALTNSNLISMLYANPQNQQALNNQLNQMWTERQKSQKDREKTLKSMQDSLAKIDGEIHKNRAKTVIDLNKSMRQLLRGGG